MENTKEIPRRNRLDLYAPAETAIYNAMQEVEKMPADVKLTEAVTLLAKAKELVSDFVDTNDQKAPCNNCQGCGCPVCCGGGLIYVWNKIIVKK